MQHNGNAFKNVRSVYKYSVSARSWGLKFQFQHQIDYRIPGLHRDDLHVAALQVFVSENREEHV